MNDQKTIGQLHQALNELEAINRIIGRICQVGETNHIMAIIVEELVKFAGADQGVINLVRPDLSDDMETVVRDGGKRSADDHFKLDDILAGWVLTHKTILRVDDLDGDGRFVGLKSHGGKFKSLICCPMLTRGEIIGLTTLVRGESSGPFTESHMRVTGIIALQSAPILTNTLLLEKLARKNQLLELSQQSLREEYARLQAEVGKTFVFENIVGKSPAMKRVLALASKVSANDVPVLITGPTGTGKELVARAIHYNSRRRECPFVVKNCGVKTESLLESELFGHVKGAFTGADRPKAGLFREADGGTVFLDEIGDAPLSTQAAILRVLENGEIRPIGAGRTEFVDVRIISATNRDLGRAIKEGAFREDLFYRLNTVTIEMPSLGHRPEDIPLLVGHFLERLKVKPGYERLSVAPEAMAALARYSWPGNVRQLQNEIERAAVVCDTGGAIDLHHLSPDVQRGVPEGDDSVGQGTLRRVVEKVEREMIVDALAATGGNILKTSEMLGLTRKGLKDKMARYGIDSNRASE